MFAYNRRRFLESTRLYTYTSYLTTVLYPHCHCHCRDSILFSEQKRKEKKKERKKKHKNNTCTAKNINQKFSFAFCHPSIIMSSSAAAGVVAIDGTDYTIVPNLDYVASTYIAVSLFHSFLFSSFSCSTRLAFVFLTENLSGKLYSFARRI